MSQFEIAQEDRSFVRSRQKIITIASGFTFTSPPAAPRWGAEITRWAEPLHFGLNYHFPSEVDLSENGEDLRKQGVEGVGKRRNDTGVRCIKSYVS